MAFKIKVVFVATFISTVMQKGGGFEKVNTHTMSREDSRCCDGDGVEV
jgi:hypothetical protein